MRGHLSNGIGFGFTVQINKQRVCDTAPAEISVFAEHALQGSLIQQRQVHKPFRILFFCSIGSA